MLRGHGRQAGTAGLQRGGRGPQDAGEGWGDVCRMRVCLRACSWVPFLTQREFREHNSGVAGALAVHTAQGQCETPQLSGCQITTQSRHTPAPSWMPSSPSGSDLAPHVWARLARRSMLRARPGLTRCPWRCWSAHPQLGACPGCPYRLPAFRCVLPELYSNASNTIEQNRGLIEQRRDLPFCHRTQPNPNCHPRSPSSEAAPRRAPGASPVHVSMYIEDFESFYQQAEELYRARPIETRYCIKYRNCDGKLVLKVTDDRTVGSSPWRLLFDLQPGPLNSRNCLLLQCLQYKTDQQTDLKKLERLNNLFFALMAKGDVSPGAACAWRRALPPPINPMCAWHQCFARTRTPCPAACTVAPWLLLTT